MFFYFFCNTITVKIKYRTPHAKAFTLIEIMVTIFIIAIIAGVVIVSAQKVRSKNKIGELIHFDNSIQAELQEYLVASCSFEEGLSGTVKGKLYKSSIVRAGYCTSNC